MSTAFLEDYLLSENRLGEVAKLFDEDHMEYWFYSVLAMQNAKDEGSATKLGQWLQKMKKTSFVDAPKIKKLLLRQALKENEPKQSKALVEMINSVLSGRDKDIRVKELDEEEEVKTSYTVEPPMRLIQKGVNQGAIRDIFTYEATPDLAKYASKNPVSADQIGDILDLIATEPTDQQHLITLIVKDLRNNKSAGWGSRAIHKKMTRDQMDTVLLSQADLMEDMKFCESYAVKLRGRKVPIVAGDVAELNEYLANLFKFSRSSKTLLSFKALITFNYLCFLECSYEQYDRETLRDYLSIPKNSEFMAEKAGEKKSQDNNYSIDGIPELVKIGEDTSYLKRALRYFYSTGDKAGSWPSLNADWALVLWAEEALLAERGNEKFQIAQRQTLDKYNGRGYSQELQTQRILQLTPMNRTFYRVDEEVELDLWLKNINSIVVNVYLVCSEAYYVQQLKEVPADLNLSGCEPYESFDLSYDDRNEMSLIKERIRVSSLSGRKGLFIIDVLGGDIGVRAVIRKGCLRFIERQVDDGYRMKVLDEDNNVQEDGKVWVAGNWYRPDETGEILVPFAGVTNLEEPIVASTESNSSVALLSTFDRKEYKYQLVVGFYVEREHMLSKKTAKLVMRPNLFINEFAISLVKNLTNCTLTMTTTDDVGAQCTRVVDVQLKDNEETVSEFLVPVSLRTVECVLQGTVNGVSVSATQLFECNKMDDEDYIADMFMYTAGKAGYVISVQGKNGEPYADERVSIELEHRMFQETLKVDLKTDHNGMIYIGKLANIRSVLAHATNKVIYPHQKWNLLVDKVNVPPVICAQVGDPIMVPWLTRPNTPPRLRIYDEAYANAYHDKAVYRRGYVRITDLPAGDYICYIRDGQAANVALHVQEGKTLELSGNLFVQGKSKSLELSEAVPLQITKVQGKRDTGYKLTLDGINENTRVHMFATTHLPRYTAFSLLAAPNMHPEVNGYRSLLSEYGCAHAIASEVNYVNNRKTPSAVPNMLTPPSVLAGKWAPGPVPEAPEFVAKPADNKIVPNRERLYDKALMEVYGADLKALIDTSNLEFLRETSLSYPNLKPNEEGVVEITRDMYTEQHRLLYFVGVDEDNTVLRHIILNESQFPQGINDCTLTPGLPVDEHYMERRRCMCLMPGDKLQIEDILTSEFEPFEGIDEIFYLYRALKSQESAAAKAAIHKYEWIVRWHTLSVEERLANWEAFQSNEVNFFLFKKDNEFFQKVVVPALKSKLQKSFFDKYLLNEDLTMYQRLDLLVTLNCFEKVLLAERLQGTWAENCCRNIESEASLIPNCPQENDRRILLALKSRQLSQDLMDATMKPPADDAKGEDDGGEKEVKADEVIIGMGIVAEKQVSADKPTDLTMRYEDRWYADVPLAKQTADLIVPSRFWSQYAKYVCGLERNRGAFLSDQVILCTKNLSEMLLALAVTDLPFEAPSPTVSELPAQASRRPAILNAKHPVMVFIKEIAPSVVRTSTFSISTNYFDPSNRTAVVDGQTVDRFLLPKDTVFKTGKVYGCRAVITNVSSTKQLVELLMQIPGGSIPVQGTGDSGFRTKNFHVQISPFDTHKKEYFFYWPSPGTFDHWPAHINKNDYTVGFSSMPTTVRVAENPSEIVDNYVAHCEVGNTDKILEYLDEVGKTKKFYDVDLTLLRPSCLKDYDFWRNVLNFLLFKNIYVDKLWSVSLTVALTEDAQPFLGQYLARNKDFRDAVGPDQDNKVVSYRGYDHRDYQYNHLSPFTNTRVETTDALPTVFTDKYNSFLDRLALNSSSISTVGLSDKAALCCYLIKQSRFDRALSVFKTIDAKAAAAEFEETYNYMSAFFSLSMNDTDRALKIAQDYYNNEDMPPQHRGKWEAIVKQCNESKDVSSADITFIPDRIAVAPPMYGIQCLKHKLRIDHNAAARGPVMLEFWVMDLEMLFSVQPFAVTMDSYRFMQPNHIIKNIKLTGGKKTVVDIPSDLHNSNAIIRLTWGVEGQEVVINDYDNEIDVQVSREAGEVRVVSTEQKSCDEPVAGAYCKVYSKNNDGTTQFYKDGYTDIRGRFNFRDISTSDQNKAVRFALLVTTKLGSSKCEIEA